MKKKQEKKLSGKKTSRKKTSRKKTSRKKTSRKTARKKKKKIRIKRKKISPTVSIPKVSYPLLTIVYPKVIHTESNNEVTEEPDYTWGLEDFFFLNELLPYWFNIRDSDTNTLHQMSTIQDIANIDNVSNLLDASYKERLSNNSVDSVHFKNLLEELRINK